MQVKLNGTEKGAGRVLQPELCPYLDMHMQRSCIQLYMYGCMRGIASYITH